MATRGWVAFIPSDGFTDGLIRIMTTFDQSLLQKLFGFGWTGYEGIGAGIFLTALKRTSLLTLARIILTEWCSS
jgi:hypothetical protein